MNTNRFIQEFALTIFAFFVFTVAFPVTANAHCDTMNGPVIKDARVALDKNDVTAVLKWVKKEHEDEIKTLFTKTIAVRKQSQQAKELADRLFFETLVRLHRAGEGAPYTGLKDEPVERIVQEADHSIETGNGDELFAALANSIQHQLHEKYERVVKAKATMNTGVEAGREYVDAYVQYVHFVEQLGMIGSAHGGEHKESNEDIH
ncbi:MAG: hypothetical protein HYV29_13830 [Ignavibacteriales bacterium]|nr:hypothetical protein [Ignavibacteriales bacterium]